MRYKETSGGLLVPEKGLVTGKYLIEHFRKGEKIDEWEAENTVVNQGLVYLLNAGLYT